MPIKRAMKVALALVLAGLLAHCEDLPKSKPAPKIKADTIYTAAMLGDIARVNLLLKQNPALINAQNESGLTPLHLAAWKGQTEMVKFLLERGAEVNVSDANGDTPLHFAASWGFKEIVKLLLNQGAKVNARNRDGKTPLSRVNPAPSPEVVQILRQQGGVE